MPTPPTSSNSIFASPTREAVDCSTDRVAEKCTISQEEKKVEKEITLERNFSDRVPNREDKDVDNTPNAGKEQCNATGDQGAGNEKGAEKSSEDDETLSMHNTFMDIVIR